MNKTEKNGILGELAVKAYIARCGWEWLEGGSRDSKYDLMVVMDDNKTESVQVKTFTSGSTFPKIVDRSGERVSHNGKTRNSTDYAEHGIDWMVGVHLIDDDPDNPKSKCYFYRLETYKQISGKTIHIKNNPPDEFPRKKDEKKVDESSNLTKFI